MNKISFHFLVAVSIIFFLSNFMNCTSTYDMFRRLQEEVTKKAPDFEEQVRGGDLLSEDLLYQICDVKKLRFLTIGGPAAFAENLERNQTYPHLLCDGDRIVGPHLKPEDVEPCIHKMIAHNIYDVIVLDLYHESNESLLNLTRRLKHRFPKAKILNMRQWFPGDLGFKHRKGWVRISTWAKHHGYTSMTTEFLEKFKNSSRPWTIKNDEHYNYYNRNNRENHVWSLFKDDPATFDKTDDYWKETLLRRAWMYDDWYVVNEKGHKDIARGVCSLSLWNATNTRHEDYTNPWDENNYDC